MMKVHYTELHAKEGNGDREREEEGFRALDLLRRYEGAT